MDLVVAEVVRGCVPFEPVVDLTDGPRRVQLEPGPVFSRRGSSGSEDHVQDVGLDLVDGLVDCPRAVIDVGAHVVGPFGWWLGWLVGTTPTGL